MFSAVFAQEAQWIQSYDAGYYDLQGAYAGGSEIMHLVPHKGRVYAANGYWVDRHWVIPPDAEKQSAQVLRLDTSNAQWQVDLDLGKTNEGLPLNYMKGNILKSVTFTRHRDGTPLSHPVNLLVMAAGTNFDRGGAVSAWIRNDHSGKWEHTLVRHGSSLGGIRWVPRDMEVYLDKVTGQELLLLSLGNPGIISGVYDPDETPKIRWSRNLEYPFPEEGSFRTRPLGMVEVNGSLYISEGSAIYRRIDGQQPRYEEVLNLQEDADSDIGGIRGLTAIKTPGSPGQSLLFLWAASQRSRSEVKRLDPDGKGGFHLTEESSMQDLMSKHLDVTVSYTLGAHNMMYPVKHPKTGETVHLIGFQGNIRGKHHLRWGSSALYAGALYAIRFPDGRYEVQEVNNPWAEGKPVLITPRAFCLSPFDTNQLFLGGHDASRRISDDMAWIFKAPISVVLGLESGQTASPSTPPTIPDERLRNSPIYELRIYQAAERRHAHLIKRFKEHTDRIFKKHQMKAIGYWIPVEGTYKQKRKFVYILKHHSRYDAYRNWNHFTIDAEWERIIDTPEFKGVLSDKPESLFMNRLHDGLTNLEANPEPGGIYNLLIYTSSPGMLPALTKHVRHDATKLFRKHGIRKIGSWEAFDRPHSDNTLICMIHHRDQKAAEQSWTSLRNDREWQRLFTRSHESEPLLIKEPEHLFLKGLPFSDLR